MSANLIQLVSRLSYTLMQGSLEREITDLVYDSRKVTEGSLFICITGAVSDGHKYIPDVVAKGAAAIVVEQDTKEYGIPANVTVLKVANSRTALAELSAAWFGHPAEQLTTIGVTGTKGKTTTTYMMREMMEHAGLKTGLIGTIEVIIGEKHIPAVNTTPESYLVQKYFRDMVDAGIRYVVMEVSSQALKLERVGGFTFDYGIFTNLEEDHIGGAEHPDMADYIRCKGLLFQRCKLGLINADADYLEEVMAGHTCPLESFGLNDNADLYATDIRRVQRAGYLGVEYDLKGLEEYHVRVDIPGDFTVYNSLAAISLCRHLGVKQEDILAALDEIQVKGRLEIVSTPGEYTLMIDYAHNAMSLEALLVNIRKYGPKRIICLFGCGGNRAKSRRYEMGEVSSRLADLTVVTSDNPRNEEPMDIINDILIGVHKADGAYVTIPDRKEAIRYCMEQGGEGDVIILAGKGHEDYQEICGVKHHMDERELIAEIIAESK
jgi:UDP-N-acetylmuramoyl-L-alanyl-D-glutamate--2,6-diaminopimelate ligase